MIISVSLDFFKKEKDNMNILSIGNSFSQDAQRYIHRIAKCDGVDITTFNLYIGGCPLSRHYRNMLSEEKEYSLEMNGVSTGFKVSLKEALLNRDWDIITLQQASTFSIDYTSYKPYIDKLAVYVRECCPNAKIVIHETWAYEEGWDHRADKKVYLTRNDMFSDIHSAYEKAAKDINADFVIPSGSLIEKLIENGILKIYRDLGHLTYGTARYAVGLLWYKMLTGNSVLNNTFSDFDEEILKDDIKIIKECVEEITK